MDLGMERAQVKALGMEQVTGPRKEREPETVTVPGPREEAGGKEGIRRIGGEES